MNRRTAVAASVVFLALILTGVARADGPRSPVLHARYVGASLSRSGLSLLDDTPLSALEVEPASGSSYGGGSDTKNPMVAMLLSCMVPGWGEIYAGETTRGRVFMASEVAIWSAYGAFRIQENLRVDDYEEYAQIFAGADAGASSGYLSDMGDYIRSEGDYSYNQSVRSDARSLYPDDLEAQTAYLEANGYFDDLAWDWGTKAQFYEYRELRTAASTADRHAFYMTGLAILNRAVSAIDSAWMVRRHNAGIHGEPAARLSVVPQISDGDVGARATLEVPF